MPNTAGGIVVDPQGQTLTVDLTNSAGNRVSTYTAANGASTHTLPLEITSRTEFHVVASGVYSVSVKKNDVEIANNGAVFSTEISGGNVSGLAPTAAGPAESGAFGSDTSVTVAAPTGVAATDTAAVAAAITSVTATGGRVVLRAGIYFIDTQLTVPGGVTLEGEGVIDYGGRGGTTAPARGTILKATAAVAAVVQLGSVATNFSDDTTFDSGNTGAAIRGIVIDGANTATSCVVAISPRWLIDACQLSRAASVGLSVTSGQNGNCRDSVIAMDNRGTCVEFSSGADNKLSRCQIRGGTVRRVYLKATCSEVHECHIFPNSGSETGADVYIDGNTDSKVDFKVHNCTFGSTTMTSAFIYLEKGPRLVSIVGNDFYVDSNAASTPIIKVSTSAGEMRSLKVAGNTAFSKSAGEFTCLVEKSGASDIVNASIAGNVMRNVAALTVGFTPDVRPVGNVIRTTAGVTIADPPVAHDFGVRTAGNLTPNNTSWSDLLTSLDVTVPAAVGDTIEVGVSLRSSTEAISVFLDAVSIVSAAPVNSWGQQAAAPTSTTGDGVAGWLLTASVAQSVSGSVMRVVEAGDIESNTVTLRLRFRSGSAGVKTINATTDRALHFWAKNLGQKAA